MVELGILAAAAVGIAGDFLSGVVQNMAASAVSDLVRQRLRTTDDGTRALERFEETPQDSGRRMEAASILAGAAQSDPSYAQALNDAVNLYHQATSQGTATSGSPHHQVNISGGGISGKRHQVAGGNIDNSKKRNIRIGIGAFAVLAVVLGGYGVTRWFGGDSGSEGGDQSSVTGDTGGVHGSGIGESEAPESKTVNFDITGSSTNLAGEKTLYRARGVVTATVGEATQNYAACGLKALPGTSIVPVTIELTNTNDPGWEDSIKFSPDSALVSTKNVPSGIDDYFQWDEGSCTGYDLGGRNAPGATDTATLVLVGVPTNKLTKITLDVRGPDSVRQERTNEGDQEAHKLFSISIQG
ncbi:hypothetical protein J7E91_28560 [Streptomyces sp. ISL-99]|uniref:hypothetical protein n=1 Tax=Streptomyces sp. ISL-99 TaxID=2819193 RepID=UPI001BECEABE|nr:hypothetical protein [Streptomyces sp. ISL-99]MBT2529248.1 hypothetical protein [Streptomyces sp. ISL-99]